MGIIEQYTKDRETERINQNLREASALTALAEVLEEHKIVISVSCLSGDVDIEVTVCGEDAPTIANFIY